jgi:hypothetical protein
MPCRDVVLLRGVFSHMNVMGLQLGIAAILLAIACSSGWSRGWRPASASPCDGPRLAAGSASTLLI